MAGPYWKQQAVVGDTAWVEITLRIPNGGMPTATYSGKAAIDRIERFARQFLHGFTAGAGASGPLGAEEVQRLVQMKADAATMPAACNVRGWLFAMTRTVEGERATFVLSARLDPMRPTTELDWSALGRCTQQLGAPYDEAMAAADPVAPHSQRWEEPVRKN